MRSINYPRTSRALFCSALLLSQHAVVDANRWATGRASSSSSRSSTLAVMQPGGRNRPVRDWRAIKRESEEKLAKDREEKARQAGELVEDVEDNELDEVVNDRADRLETASAEVLGLEEGTPESLGVVVAKVAVIATVGLYGAKKVIAFTKAVLKGRKEASKDTDEDDTEVTESSAAGAASDGGDEDDDQGGEENEKAAQADDGQEEEEDEAAAEESDEVTDGDGYVTADEEEAEGEDASQGAAAAVGSKVEAAKDMATDMKERTKRNIDSFKAKAKAELEKAADRADGDGDEEEKGDLRARLPEGGKVDVSYV